MKKTFAWYFSTTGKKLSHNDNRGIAIGVTHTVKGKIRICENGLHGSIRLIDALDNAPGPVIWRVELSGASDIGRDKIAASKRKYIAGGIDISGTLRVFARKQALSVIHLWDAPDIVKSWLETGDESLMQAAESAAWSAARSAAESAAWSNTWSATESAARSAAKSAAKPAVWSAAESAVWLAAWSAVGLAAWSAVKSDAWSAARSSARSAAESAAKLAANDMLTEMVKTALEAVRE